MKVGVSMKEGLAGRGHRKNAFVLKVFRLLRNNVVTKTKQRFEMTNLLTLETGRKCDWLKLLKMIVSKCEVKTNLTKIHTHAHKTRIRVYHLFTMNIFYGWIWIYYKLHVVEKNVTCNRNWIHRKWTRSSDAFDNAWQYMFDRSVQARKTH